MSDYMRFTVQVSFHVSVVLLHKKSIMISQPIQVFYTVYIVHAYKLSIVLKKKHNHKTEAC